MHKRNTSASDIQLTSVQKKNTSAVDLLLEELKQNIPNQKHNKEEQSGQLDSLSVNSTRYPDLGDSSINTLVKSPSQGESSVLSCLFYFTKLL